MIDACIDVEPTFFGVIFEPIHGLVSLAAKGLFIAIRPSAPKAADDTARSSAKTTGSER